MANSTIPILWIELRDIEGQMSLDSTGADDLEAAVLAAEVAISSAKELAESGGGG
jgi:hypothetical protein